jgi:hypothetical protein
MNRREILKQFGKSVKKLMQKTNEMMEENGHTYYFEIPDKLDFKDKEDVMIFMLRLIKPQEKVEKSRRNYEEEEKVVKPKR